MSAKLSKYAGRALLTVACLTILATYVALIDLKPISTDEGQRVWLINGGQPFTLNAAPSPQATWSKVIEAYSWTAYPPLYFLIQNSVMRLAGTQSAVLFRLTNVFFLWVCLQGLIALSSGWRLAPRLFLLVVFSFNAYLFMHVLQVREYIVGLAFYIWSTWLVLRLDAKKVAGGWADVAWFSAFAVLLVAGFYVQSWIVFPAIAQFLFLVRRCRTDWLRYYAHLGLGYLIVCSATLPYLQANHQKVDIGRWGTSKLPLWTQVSDGFHLVLAGQLAGHNRFTDFLFVFWLLFVAGVGALLLTRKFSNAPGIDEGEFKRQALLVLMCSAVSLAFQIGYFYKVDTLSVWPRYFIIHYFFVTWLIALGFKFLCDVQSTEEMSAGMRRSLVVATGLIFALALGSGVYQARSYDQDPYFDTGFSGESNWCTYAAGISRVIGPKDVILVHDFIVRATLATARPIPNRIITLPELDRVAVASVDRVVFLESAGNVPERTSLAAKMTTMGFPLMQVVSMRSTSGNELVTDWQLLLFQHK